MDDFSTRKLLLHIPLFFINIKDTNLSNFLNQN